VNIVSLTSLRGAATRLLVPNRVTSSPHCDAEISQQSMLYGTLGSTQDASFRGCHAIVIALALRAFGSHSAIRKATSEVRF